MLMSDFRPEVEILPFRTCAMKNMQYNPWFLTVSSCLSVLYMVPSGLAVTLMQSVGSDVVA